VEAGLLEVEIRSGIDVIPDLKKRQTGKEKAGLVKLCLLISS